MVQRRRGAGATSAIIDELAKQTESRLIPLSAADALSFVEFCNKKYGDGNHLFTNYDVAEFLAKKLGFQPTEYQIKVVMDQMSGEKTKTRKTPVQDVKFPPQIDIRDLIELYKHADMPVIHVIAGNHKQVVDFRDRYLPGVPRDKVVNAAMPGVFRGFKHIFTVLYGTWRESGDRKIRDALDEINRLKAMDRVTEIDYWSQETKIVEAPTTSPRKKRLKADTGYLTPKKSGNTPKCRVCRVDMDFNPIVNYWECPTEGCGMTARPKRTNEDMKEPIIGQGAITIQIIETSKGDKEIFLCSDDNVCLPINSIISNLEILRNEAHQSWTVRAAIRAEITDEQMHKSTKKM